MSDLLFKDKKKKTYTKKSNTKIKTTIDNRHNQKLTEITELEKTITEKNNLLEKAKIQLEVYNQKEMKYLSDKEISLKLELIENIK